MNLEKYKNRGIGWYLSTPLYALRLVTYPLRYFFFRQRTKIFGVVNLLRYRRAAKASSAVRALENTPLISCLCTQAQIESPLFRDWAVRRGQSPHIHRKEWELSYISQALFERGLLAPGKKGLVFAVGTEALPALFAKMGCEIVASDMDADEAAAAGWVETNQHASSLATLNQKQLCPPDEFAQRVSFRVVDMNRIPADLMQEQFDFVWSTCSLEHLGSIAKGQKFILNSLRCLKPGGVAIHTTEYNCSSNFMTISRGAVCLFRKRDIEKTVRQLREAGCQIDINYNYDRVPTEKYVDVPPYGKSHLYILLDGFICTSIGLIIHKPAAGN